MSTSPGDPTDRTSIFPFEPKERLQAALSEVNHAKSSLEAALNALHARPRAEKVGVTAAVTDAFDRLRAAAAELLAIRSAIDDDGVPSFEPTSSSESAIRS